MEENNKLLQETEHLLVQEILDAMVQHISESRRLKIAGLLESQASAKRAITRAAKLCGVIVLDQWE